MPIDVTCSGCNQKLKAKDSLAGKTVACPKCTTKITIPLPVDDAASFLLQNDPAPVPQPETRPETKMAYATQDPPEPETPAPAPKKPASTKSTKSNKSSAKVSVKNAIVSTEAPFWLRNLHWLLILTLIPLAISILQAQPDSLGQRLETTLDKATPEQQFRAIAILDNLAKDPEGFEKLFSVFPGNKLTGAFLARDSKVHWGLALASITLFLGFFAVLAMTGSANPLHLLIVGVITATVGILLLIGVQMMAGWSQRYIATGRSILVVFFYIIKFIGYSYQMARDTNEGFFPSFFGFTFGVGLCEELVKIIPVLFKVKEDDKLTWHGAFLWGLASGAGFGISEGIMYSANYYNGTSGWDTYLVRFTSCVALHALWTGSAAIILQQQQHLFHQLENWYSIIPPLFLVLGISMVFHGLYDTMLKKDMETGALIIAMLSFVFLAIQNSMLHGADTRQATDKMLKEYQNRQKARA